MISNVTHLHKTSHKSPNIKWQESAFYLKMSKMCFFFVFIKTTFLGQVSFKIIVFCNILLDFSSICDSLKVLLMMLKYDCFSLTAIFSLLWALRFDVFTVFQNSITLDRKDNIDFWFSPICSTDCILQSGILNSTCKKLRHKTGFVQIGHKCI